MVSDPKRQQSVRQTHTDSDDRRARIQAKRDAFRRYAARHAARVAASNGRGVGGVHPVGSAGLLVDMGESASAQRPYSAPNPSALGRTVSKNILIAGPASSGKTTLVRDLTHGKRLRVGGFYLEPQMAGRIKKGYIMRTFDGQERVLASRTIKSNHKWGAFALDLNALENVGVPALKLALMTKDVVVIDEIGQFESLSEKFRLAVLEVLNSTKPVLATMPNQSNEFLGIAKKITDTQLLQINKTNINNIRQQSRKWLESQL